MEQQIAEVLHFLILNASPFFPPSYFLSAFLVLGFCLLLFLVYKTIFIIEILSKWETVRRLQLSFHVLQDLKKILQMEIHRFVYFFFLFHFFFLFLYFLYCFPKVEQNLWHIWLQGLWNHFAVWAFLILLKWTKEGVSWGKRSKQISAFEDVSSVCMPC